MNGDDMSKTIKGVKTTDHEAAEALLAGREMAAKAADGSTDTPPARAFLTLESMRIYLQPHIDAARTAALAAQSEQPKTKAGPKPVAS